MAVGGTDTVSDAAVNSLFFAPEPVSNNPLVQQAEKTIKSKAPKAVHNKELDAIALGYAKAVAAGKENYHDPRFGEIAAGNTSYSIKIVTVESGIYRADTKDILSDISSNASSDTVQYGLALYSQKNQTLLAAALTDNANNKSNNPSGSKPVFIVRKDLAQKIFAEINKQRIAAGATKLSWSESLAGWAEDAARDAAQLKGWNMAYPDYGGAVIYGVSASDIKDAADQILKTIQDIGTIPMKDGVASTDDPDRIPAKYPYPLLQNPDYKEVGIGICEKQYIGSEYDIVAYFKK